MEKRECEGDTKPEQIKGKKLCLYINDFFYQIYTLIEMSPLPRFQWQQLCQMLIKRIHGMVFGVEGGCTSRHFDTEGRDLCPENGMWLKVYAAFWLNLEK